MAAAVMLSSCAYVQQVRELVQPETQPGWPSELICRGDFAQFSNGFMVARPMELHFAVWWSTPAVQPLDGGGRTKILSLTALEFSFEVPYEGYKVWYHLNRVDGTFTQRPNLGGVFSGNCSTKPLLTTL